jgi:hypothetical protein
MNILPLSFRGLLTNGSTLAYMGQRAGRPDDPPNKSKYIDENGVFHQTVRTTKPVETKPEEKKQVENKSNIDENGVFHQTVRTTKPVETKPEEKKQVEKKSYIDENGVFHQIVITRTIN